MKYIVKIILLHLIINTIILVKCSIGTNFLDTSFNQQISSLSHGEKNEKWKNKMVLEITSELNSVQISSGTDVPQLKVGEMILQDLCDRNNNNNNITTYQQAHIAVMNIFSCFDEIIHFTEMPQMIKESRGYGNATEVFSHYCKKMHEMQECTNKLLMDLDPCLRSEEKDSKSTLQNIIAGILHFMCDEDGGYLALFMSESGPECITEKQPEIEVCLRMNFNHDFEGGIYNESGGIPHTKSSELSNESSENRSPSSEMSIQDSYNGFEFENITDELQQCRKTYKIEKCIVNELRKCNRSTPVNVIESLFNIAKKATNCVRYSKKELDPSSNAVSVLKSSSSYSILIALIVYYSL